MSGRRPLRVLLLTPNFENNSLGRTHCLWMLGRELGWDIRIAGVKGTTLWGPLVSNDLARDCVLPAVSTVDDHLRPGVTSDRLHEGARWADLIIAVKPLPTSFGVALRLSASHDRPLLLDVDDPDLEVRTSWRPAYYRWTRPLVSARYRSLQRLARTARSVPTMVSNPVLQRSYGGPVIPHVRPRQPPGTHRDTTAPVVRFVGSPRGHKGVAVLREAVARVAGRGVRLEITAEPPADARPWETWLGTTTYDQGQSLVAGADVVAVPSLRGGWSPSQLPAKLVDALTWGRPVVASDVGPIGWALADGGLLVPPGDVAALSRALEQLTDPHLRRDLGRRAHARGVAAFSVEAVAPALGRAADRTVEAWGSRGARVGS